MLDKAHYIVVEGPIGAGKPSLARRLADRYTRYFYQYEAAPLFIVDAGQLNPVDNDEDFEMLLARLRDMRGYREFFGYGG